MIKTPVRWLHQLHRIQYLTSLLGILDPPILRFLIQKHTNDYSLIFLWYTYIRQHDDPVLFFLILLKTSWCHQDMRNFYSIRCATYVRNDEWNPSGYSRFSYASRMRKILKLHPFNCPTMIYFLILRFVMITYNLAIFKYPIKKWKMEILAMEKLRD